MQRTRARLRQLFNKGDDEAASPAPAPAPPSELAPGAAAAIDAAESQERPDSVYAGRPEHELRARVESRRRRRQAEAAERAARLQEDAAQAAAKAEAQAKAEARKERLRKFAEG